MERKLPCDAWHPRAGAPLRGTWILLENLKCVAEVCPGSLLIIDLSTFCWWLSNHWILLSGIFVGIIPNLTAQTLVVHKNHAGYSCKTSWNAEKWIWNCEKPCFYWNKVIVSFRSKQVITDFQTLWGCLKIGYPKIRMIDQFPLIDGHRVPSGNCQRINRNHVKIMPEFHSGVTKLPRISEKRPKPHSEALAMPPEFVQHFPWNTRQFQIPAASETLAMPLTNGRFVKV